MKLKNVAHAISVEKLIFFFFDVVQPSNIAQAILPLCGSKG